MAMELAQCRIVRLPATDCDLNIATAGDDRNFPLVLVHGLGADMAMWEPQLAALTEAGFFLVIPDLPGHGHSTVPERFSIRHCASVIKELLGVLGISRAAFAGVSLGGLVVQQIVDDFPAMVSKMIIIDSFSSTATVARKANAWLASALLRLVSTETMARMIERTYRRPQQRFAREYLAERMRSMDIEQVRQERREANRFCIVDRLPGMHVPALVLVGDLFGRMAIRMARETADLLPDARFAVLPGSCDPSNMIAVDEVNAHIERFLARQD